MRVTMQNVVYSLGVLCIAILLEHVLLWHNPQPFGMLQSWAWINGGRGLENPKQICWIK